ncbi:MAG TPA: hypothetical protein DD391_04155 [Clostridiales bacterium]|nr:AraC family transcriptional regulator [Clostridiales bacterium]HBL81780.1 hypothetical protein [Clostridiales bacterium]
MIYKREYYKSTNYFSCDITPKRVTQYYELEIYDYGTGCASIDNILYPHNQNMVIFSKPFQERFTIGSFNCYAIHFTCGDNEICQILSSIPDCIIIDPLIKKQLLNLYELTNIENNLETIVSIGRILNIIKNSNYHIHNEITHNSKIAMTVKEYIDNHYQSPIHISDFEKMVHLSVNYIRKLFLDCYGVTIHKYITELRLSHVKKLLLSTDLPIIDIAYKSGFSSQSHMNYMFKSVFGISPLKYKKMQMYGTQ